MDDKKTIVYLVRPAEGGIKNHLLTLLNHLDKTRYSPIVVSPSGTSLFAELKASGLDVRELNISDSLNPAADVKYIFQFRRMIKKIKPAIIHMHSAKAGIVGRLSLIGMINRPKTIVTMHSFVMDERVGSCRRRLVRMLERLLHAKTDRFIAVSEALKNNLVDSMGISANKINVVHNGIQFADFEKKKSDKIKIVAISRLAPQKGVDYFIKAAAIVAKKHQNAVFSIFGDGPLRDDLEKLANELGISDKLTFHGFSDEILNILPEYSIFVIASIHEAFGLSLIEAMSVKLPVIASRTGGITEIIDGCSTGLFAEPGNPEDIANQICRLIENPELAEKLAINGYEHVKRSFSADRMAAETQKIYDDLLV